MPLTADRIPKGWDDDAEAYDRVAFPVTSQYATEAVRQLEVKPGDSVLDVAAGSGAATVAALEQGAEVVATDFAPKMIDRLKARLGDLGLTAESIVMDGQDLRFADSTFDKAISVFGLIFFPDRLKGMKEMLRVLKPAGRAAIVSWASPDRALPLSLWGKTIVEVLPDLPPPSEPPAVFSLSDPDRFEAEMKEAGFFDVKVSTFTSTFDAKSPEDYWNDWHRASPVITTLIDALGDKLEDYKKAIIGHVRERFGSGEISMDAEALIGVGTKA